MKKRMLIGIGFIGLLLVITIVAWGIKSNSSQLNEEQDQTNVIEVPSDLIETTEEDPQETSESMEGKVMNPLTGLNVDEVVLTQSPITVMLDNFYSEIGRASCRERVYI